MRTPPAPPLACVCLACLVALALVASLPGCGDKDGQAQGQGPTGPAVPVTVQPAATDSVQRWVEVAGTLYGEEEVTVSNKVNGKVIAIYKEFGDRAKAGEPLAQLLRNDYQLAINQRRSALDEALAQLGLEELPGDDFDVSELPSVRQAQLQARNAEARYVRGKQLHDQDPPLLSDQDFADLETARDVAASNYEVELLKVRALVGAVGTRAAELAIAEQAMKDTTIRAPRPMADDATGDDGAARRQQQQGDGDGDDDTPSSPATAPAATAPAVGGGDSFVIYRRYASVGELLPAVSRMFELVDDDPLKLRAPVPERFSPQVEVGQKVEVAVSAYDRTFAGTIARINPQVDPASRSFEIEVTVPNAEHLLRPGGFATARVMTRVEQNVVFVPRDAVVTFAGVNKVFTVKDGKAVEVAVELGERQKDRVEVAKGLKANAPVVTSGAGKLATGVPVTVQTNAAPATAPAEASARGKVAG